MLKIDSSNFELCKFAFDQCPHLKRVLHKMRPKEICRDLATGKTLQRCRCTSASDYYIRDVRLGWRSCRFLLQWLGWGEAFYDVDKIEQNNFWARSRMCHIQAFLCTSCPLPQFMFVQLILRTLMYYMHSCTGIMSASSLVLHASNFPTLSISGCCTSTRWPQKKTGCPPVCRERHLESRTRPKQPQCEIDSQDETTEESVTLGSTEGKSKWDHRILIKFLRRSWDGSLSKHRRDFEEVWKKQEPIDFQKMAPCPNTPIISSPITPIIAPCSSAAQHDSKQPPRGVLHPQTTTSNNRTLYLTRCECD